MDNTRLFFYLFIAVGGAALIWLITRFICLHLTAKVHTNYQHISNQNIQSENTDKSENMAINTVYFNVFILRIAGLMLCLLALVVWVNNFAWPICIALAGSGCIFQYLAYKKRQKFAMAKSVTYLNSTNISNIDFNQTQVPTGSDSQEKNLA